MRHYARENEKSQARIAQLEQRKSTCEAGLVAIAACWEQVRCLVVGRRPRTGVLTGAFLSMPSW